MTTPTPSDAAMAAASEISSSYYVSRRHAGSWIYQVPTDEIATIIDRHFAPPRDELARLTVESERQRGHHIDTMIELGGCQLERMTLRASNDKLRAALEEALDCDVLANRAPELWERISAALAPERKERP